MSLLGVDPRSPVIVGVGQLLHRARGLDDALDATALMAASVRAAASDAGLSAVPNPQSLRVVSLLSWRYGNAPRFVADLLGLQPDDLAYTTNGGNSPQSLVNATAAEIQSGALDIAILTGGEAFRTRMRARKLDATLTWPKADDGDTPRIIGEDLVMNHPGEIARNIVMPVQVYPMFESAIRARAGGSVDDHQRRITGLWSRFSEVSASNPYAWSQRVYSPDEIGTPSTANRMIGLPYPKLMNSNNDVDMAAALIICSAERAAALGIARDRWVFVHAGTDCHEHQFISERWSFDETPAIRLGGSRALQLAGMGIDDVAVVDLYSCFPAAVQLGAQSLGLSLDRQLTRTGGLSFAGGPWNNYVMHAIATVVDELRQRPGDAGLVWANGGYTTKHAFGLYSTTPPKSGFRHAHPQDEIDALGRRSLAEPADAAGEQRVEAFTVMHARDGSPETAIVTAITSDGRRAWGTSSDQATATALCDGEWVGRSVTFDADGTLHI